ncbi:NAD(P)-dependent oxidoreductase [Alphaproteobacteria bacterium LSUCC0684]
MNPDLVISEFMEERVVAELSRLYRTLYDPDLVRDRPRLMAELATARGLIVRNRTEVDAELIAAAPRLCVIGRLGVGLDNIDQEAASRRGIAVCPATGANADSVAEYVIAASLQLLRPVFSSTAEMLAGTFPRARLSDGREIAGCILGLVGGGIIGRAVAARASALGMEILIADPALGSGRTAEGWQVTSLEDCLAAADVVSLHLPLTRSTAGLFGAERLRSMKPGCVLINTARGGIVDHSALAELMKAGHVSGAALDVFEEEPADAASLAMFEGVENLILTPHIAGLTHDSNIRVSEMTARNVQAHMGPDGEGR